MPARGDGITLCDDIFGDLAGAVVYRIFMDRIARLLGRLGFPVLVDDLFGQPDFTLANHVEYILMIEVLDLSSRSGIQIFFVELPVRELEYRVRPILYDLLQGFVAVSPSARRHPEIIRGRAGCALVVGAIGPTIVVAATGRSQRGQVMAGFLLSDLE